MVAVHLFLASENTDIYINLYMLIGYILSFLTFTLSSLDIITITKQRYRSITTFNTTLFFAITLCMTIIIFGTFSSIIGPVLYTYLKTCYFYQLFFTFLALQLITFNLNYALGKFYVDYEYYNSYDALKQNFIKV